MLNTGPHSCIWGGLQLSSAGTDFANPFLYDVAVACTYNKKLVKAVF